MMSSTQRCSFRIKPPLLAPHSFNRDIIMVGARRKGGGENEKHES
jgi:hypothetical protein